MNEELLLLASYLVLLEPGRYNYSYLAEL